MRSRTPWHDTQGFRTWQNCLKVHWLFRILHLQATKTLAWQGSSFETSDISIALLHMIKLFLICLACANLRSVERCLIRLRLKQTETFLALISSLRSDHVPLVVFFFTFKYPCNKLGLTWDVIDPDCLLLRLWRGSKGVISSELLDPIFWLLCYFVSNLNLSGERVAGW